MNSFKIFVIALVTSVASQLLLTPYIIRLHDLTASDPAIPTRPAPVAPVDPPPPPPPEAPEPPPPPTPSPTPKLGAPNLEGSLLDEARDRWRAKGIIIIEDGERSDSGAAPGTILQQRPSPGAALDSKEIRVVVAKTAESKEVPSTVGLLIDEGRRELVAAGFDVPAPKRETSTEPQGTILRQIPGPGSSAPAGSIVRLVVAEPASISVPKVRGLPLSRAKRAIEDLGLVTGKIRRVEDPELDENTVLRQEPAPDEKVPPGTKIDLVVVAAY